MDDTEHCRRSVSRSEDGGSEEGELNGQSVCVMDQSPGRRKFWKPYCDEKLKPYCGQEFRTVETGVRFYKEYAAIAGFDVRCSTGRRDKWGEIEHKYLLCSREGKKSVQKPGLVGVAETEDGQNEPRRRVSNRVDCMARLVLKRNKNGIYVVHKLIEEHTHCLCSEIGRPFLKGNRKLNVAHQAFITHCANANIGPSNTFRLYKEIAGSYANVGATSVEFHNFKRDLNEFLVEGDAQMLIDKYKKRIAMCDGFTFDYDVDEDRHLRRVFWADKIAKQNYKRFGDVVSFDATYQTNRYSMVFVPFTGVDNHKNCITFAAGLLMKEDIPSYSWLLEKFIGAMGTAPNYVITDEDPAMKVAIADKLPKTRHRYCTWHIMSKVSEKVGNNLAKDEVFRLRLNALVWDERIGAEEFERKWTDLISEYDLGEHRWFKKLYQARVHWISGFFTGVKMGGLMRTTSRSEAINGVFGKITNRHASLMDFFKQFEGGIDAQRHRHDRLTGECEGAYPTLKTPLEIEKQAASEYTVTLFYEVREEICASCFSCHVRGTNINGILALYTIEESGGRRFHVQLHTRTGAIDCTCKLFERVGILCRHVFTVYKEVGVKRIPGEYILGRWTRRQSSEDVQSNSSKQLGDDEEGNVASKVMNEFFQCLALARGDEMEMKELCSLIEGHKNIICERKGSSGMGPTKEDALMAFYGTAAPQSITILPPTTAKNKGSGKRLKSNREKAIEESAKPKRLCRTCKQYSHHDSRNCPGV